MILWIVDTFEIFCKKTILRVISVIPATILI